MMVPIDKFTSTSELPSSGSTDTEYLPLFVLSVTMEFCSSDTKSFRQKLVSCFNASSSILSARTSMESCESPDGFVVPASPRFDFLIS